MSDLSREIESVINQAENQGLQQSAQRLAEEDYDDHIISEGMNFYQGVLNNSMDQVTQEDPTIIIYDHSPGFEEGQSGYGRLRGRQRGTEFERPGGFDHSKKVDSGIIPLEVQPSESLPGPHYEGKVEVALEHDGVDMQEDYPVTFTVLPFDPGSLNSADPEEFLENYSPEESDVTRTDLI